MGKNDRVIDIQKTPKDRNNWRLAEKELEERFASLQRTVSYLSAKAAYDKLMSDIPGGSEYKDLRKSLRISEIGVGDKGGAYSVHVPSRGRRIRKMDVGKTVIYVRAKKRLSRPDAGVKILEDKGPWTADTIPFWPNKKEATVVQRKVTKKEADKVAKAQKGKEAEVRAALAEVGRRIKPKKPGGPGQVKRGGKAIPDVGMQALELEFGGDGKRSKPVFRRMIGASTKGVKGLGKHKVVKQSVSDPNSKIYKQFPPKVSKIGTSVAGKFKGFQKRLGR
jgi:hypothetical protein